MEKEHGAKLFLVLLLCSVFLLLKLFWTFLAAIVLALLITSAFYPLYPKIKRVFRGRDMLSSFFMVVLILVLLVIPLCWFVGTLSNEAYEFYNRTRSSVSMQHIQDVFHKNSVWTERLKKASEFMGIEFTPKTFESMTAFVGKNIGLFLYDHIKAVASNLLTFLMHFFLMLFVIFYLFKDGLLLKEYLFHLLPIPEKQMEKVSEKFQEMGKAIILGNALSGIIQGILGGIGFFMFGLASPFLWGTVIAFMAFLPVIGASIVFIPAAAILFLQGKTGAGAGFLLYNMFYSSVMEYVIKPRMIGQGMEMNSLLVFLGIVGGIQLYGIMGLVYGPLIITIFLTLAEIYRLEYRPVNFKS